LQEPGTRSSGLPHGQTDQHGKQGPVRSRSRLRPGMTVLIVLKSDQRTGRLTEGVVQDILTRSATHPHGIKVRLTDGSVGRVQQITAAGSVEKPSVEREP